jgi:hypothetical protein
MSFLAHIKVWEDNSSILLRIFVFFCWWFIIDLGTVEKAHSSRSESFTMSMGKLRNLEREIILRSAKFYSFVSWNVTQPFYIWLFHRDGAIHPLSVSTAIFSFICLGGNNNF